METPKNDQEIIEELVEKDIEEDYDDPDYQQYIEMCRSRNNRRKL